MHVQIGVKKMVPRLSEDNPRFQLLLEHHRDGGNVNSIKWSQHPMKQDDGTWVLKKEKGIHWNVAESDTVRT